MGSRNPNPNRTRNRNGNRKKNLKRRAPPSSSSSRNYKQLLKIKVDTGRVSRRRFRRPFKIGRYASGTQPHRIPYHLYLLVKEAVVLMQRGLDSALVDTKINFFCDFFYSHLPVGWKYDKDNAAFLIAGYDTTLPKYNIPGYTPLRTRLYDDFDDAIQLFDSQVLDLMSIIHKRKTPTPETFMCWDEHIMSFYCKLCSCFGLDYLHLEAASEDDVLLMNRRNSKSSLIARHKPYLNWVEKISPNKNVRTVLYNNVINMPKLSSSDEAFALSTEDILEILRFVICSPGLPPQTTLTRWNQYQISFYSKMCSYFLRRLPPFFGG